MQTMPRDYDNFAILQNSGGNVNVLFNECYLYFNMSMKIVFVAEILVTLTIKNVLILSCTVHCSTVKKRIMITPGCILKQLLERASPTP